MKLAAELHTLVTRKFENRLVIVTDIDKVRATDLYNMQVFAE
jgi:hypothetical protein